MPIPPLDMFLGIAIPIALAVVLTAAVRILFPGRFGGRRWAAGLAMGIVGGFLGGVRWLSPGVFVFPPGVTLGWLCYFSMAVAVLGVVDAMVNPPRWGVAAVLAILVGGGGLLMFRTQFQHAWSAGVGTIWIAGITLTAVGMWGILRYVGDTVPGIFLPATLVAITSFAAALLGMSGSMTYGRLGGALAAATGVALLVGILIPSVSLSRGVPVVVAAVVASLLAMGLILSEVHLLHAGLIAVSPVFALAAARLRFTKLRPWQRLAIRLVIVCIPLATAAVMAVPKFLRSIDESSEDPYALLNSPLNSRQNPPQIPPRLNAIPSQSGGIPVLFSTSPSPADTLFSV